MASLNLLKEALNSIQEKLSNIYDEILIEIRKKGVEPTPRPYTTLASINEDILKIQDASPLFERNVRVWEDRSIIADHLTSITYGNGMYVAVGVNGASVYSYDGIKWYSFYCIFENPDDEFTGVAYGTPKGESVFVATTLFGNIYYMTSNSIGIWTKVEDVNTDQRELYNIMYENGMFIITGGYGTVLYAKNEYTMWVEMSLSTIIDLRDATYGNNKYVIVGYLGILYSDNGRTWQSVNINIPDMMVGITYGDGRFVAIGYTNNASHLGVIYTSLDGVNWEKIYEETTYRVPFNSITYSKGLFTIVGGNGVILYSYDTENWFYAIKDQQNLFDITYGNNNLFIAVGASGKIITSKIFDALASGKTVAKGKYYADNYDLTLKKGVWAKIDNRYSINKATIYGGAPIEKSVYLNNRYFAFGGSGMLYTSAGPNISSVVWSEATTGAGSNIYFYDMTYAKNMYVLVGSSKSLYTSTNGTTWTQRTVDISLSAADIRKVKYFPEIDKFIAIATGNILYSTDGITWNTVVLSSMSSLYTEKVLYDIHYDGKRFYAVGDNVFLVSSNGINWAIYNLTTTMPLAFIGKALVTAGNKTVLVGEGSTTHMIAVSIDQTKWIICSISDTTTGFKDVTYGNGIFVAVGNNGQIYTSVDAISWKKQESGTTYPLTKIAYDGTKFITIGNTTTGSKGVILISYDGIVWYDKSNVISDLNYLYNISLYTYNGVTYNLMCGIGASVYQLTQTGEYDTSPQLECFTVIPSTQVETYTLSFEPSKVFVVLKGQTIDGKRFCKINISKDTDFTVNGAKLNTYTIYNINTNVGTYIYDNTNTINGKNITIKYPSALLYDGTCEYDIYAIK